MTVQFSEIQSRLQHQEEVLCIDSKPFTGTIHRKHENGKIQTTYFNGLKHGVQKEYFPNSILAKITLYKRGRLDGRQIEYFESGSKKLHLNYKEGLKDGVCEEWNEDGSSKSLKTYYRDKLISIKSLISPLN